MIDESNDRIITTCNSSSSSSNTNHHHNSRIRNGATTNNNMSSSSSTTTSSFDTHPLTQLLVAKISELPNQQNQQQHPDKYRRRSRRQRQILQYGSWMCTRMTNWFHHQPSFLLPYSKKSSNSYSNSNNGNSSTSRTSNMQVLVLCLFGIILILFIIIAYLVVLLIESSSSSLLSVSIIDRNRTVSDHMMTFTTDTSENEYRQNFGNLLQQVHDSSGKHPTIKHSLIDTPIYSKNTIHNDDGNNKSMTISDGIDDTHKSGSIPILQNNNNELQIVWLMSFPNSGTSYTSRLVRDVTQTFTASNYADETPEGLLGERIPVYTNETYGPFWTIPAANINEYQYPTRYVLTKTHCGIRCSLCSPNEYAETTYSFRRRCLVTKWVESDSKTGRTMNVYSTYPITHVGKAVHVIRNPFDNVVSRFHLEHTNPNRTAKEYTPNRHGFLRYCLSIDYKYIQQEIKYMHFQENKLLQDLWLVPCHADFMRYIEWHNLAFITTHDLNIPTYILHYDWYSTQYERVTKELLQFLQLPTVAAPPPFVPGKVYDQYYTTKEKLIVKRAFEFMASSTTWEHIQQYFPPDT